MEKEMADIGILGAGAWAIALGLVLNKNGHHVTMWTCVEKEMQMLSTEREHKTSLPGIKIPESIDITMDITEAAVHNQGNRRKVAWHGREKPEIHECI